MSGNLFRSPMSNPAQPSVQVEAMKAIGRLYSLAYPEMYVTCLGHTDGIY